MTPDVRCHPGTLAQALCPPPDIDSSFLRGIKTTERAKESKSRLKLKKEQAFE
ncbi:hypothetical protein ACLOJK_031289 [Asimina triloba]